MPNVSTCVIYNLIQSKIPMAMDLMNQYHRKKNIVPITHDGIYPQTNHNTIAYLLGNKLSNDRKGQHKVLSLVGDICNTLKRTSYPIQKSGGRYIPLNGYSFPKALLCDQILYTLSNQTFSMGVSMFKPPVTLTFWF
jgi:hypothetical protein